MYHGLGPHVLTVFGLDSAAATPRGRPPAGSRFIYPAGHRSEAVVYTVGGLALCLAVAAAGIGLAGLA